MAKRFGPGNWPPQPTSSTKGGDAFNPERFLRDIKRQYVELGAYEEIVDPEKWEPINADLSKITKLSEEYGVASDPKQRERISTSMQKLGVSLGRRLSSEIKTAEIKAHILVEGVPSNEFETVKPEEKQPEAKGLEAFAALGDVDPEQGLGLRASKGTVPGEAKPAVAPAQEQQDAAYAQSKLDAEKRAGNTTPEDQTVRGKTLQQLKEESVNPKERLSAERQQRKLTKAILAHISGESTEAIGNILSATDVDVSNEERQELMALLADPATRDRAAGLLETLPLSPKKMLEYGNQFTGLINEAAQVKTPEVTGKAEEVKLREAQEQAVVDANIAQRAAAEQVEKDAAEAEKLAAVQSKLGITKPTAPAKPAEAPASVPVMQPFNKTSAGSFDPDFVSPNSRQAMYQGLLKEGPGKATDAKDAKPSEKPPEVAPIAPTAPKVDASEMQAPQYGREKVLRNMQKDIDGLARGAEAPASVRPSNEPYAVFRSNRKAAEETSTAEFAAPTPAVEAPPAAPAAAESSAPYSPQFVDVGIPTNEYEAQIAAGAKATNIPADDKRPARDFFSRQVLGDAFVNEQQKSATVSQSSETKPKGVSMADLAGDYDAKKSQEDLYQRYTKGQQTETKPKASSEGGPLDPYRKKFASMRDAFLRFSNKYPGIAQMPEDVVNRFYELNDRMKKNLKSENVDMDALESAAIDADALTAQLTEQNKAENDLGKIVPNPEDAIDPEHAREMAGKNEGTRGEWTKRLREAIGRLTGGAAEKTKWYTSSEEKLIRRKDELDAKAEKIGGLEGFFRSVGEKYNKLGFKYKLALGVTLGLGAGISLAAASLPAIIGFTFGVAAQRTAGLASMYLKFEKASPPYGGEREKKFWQWGQREKAMGKAILYTTAMTAGMAYAMKEISETAWAQRTQEWLGDMLKRFSPGAASGRPEGSSIPVLEQSSDEVSAGTESATTGVGPASAEATPTMPPTMPPAMPPAVAETAGIAPNRVEVPLVLEKATPGKGYEFMAKRMWEQLGGLNLNPDNYDKSSDIYKLLTADAKSINDVVHEIAGKHAFYKPDGTSFRIDLGSSMTINAEGNLQVDSIINAPPTPVTPVYPAAEAAAAYRAPLGPNDMPQGVASPDVVPAAPQGEPPASRVEQPAAASPAQPGAEQPLVWRDSSGNVVRDGSGNPINSGSYEEPAPTARVEAPAAGAAQAPMVEHLKEFVNKNNVPVDPLRGHVFADSSGAALAYGNDFAARLDAAQVFAKANPDTSVWVQAEKLVLVDGVLRPYVFEVKYTGLVFKSMQIISPDAPVDAAHIGAVDPNTFTKPLDK